MQVNGENPVVNVEKQGVESEIQEPDTTANDSGSELSQSTLNRIETNPEKLEKFLHKQIKLQKKAFDEVNQVILDQFASQTSHQQLLNKSVDLVKTDFEELRDKMNTLMQQATKLQTELSSLPQKAVQVKQLLASIQILEDKYLNTQKK